MSLLLALALTSFVQQEGEEHTKMPEGWVSGKKSGWDGDYPPGWEKKTDEEKKKVLEQWNAAKSRYIKAVMGMKGNPTGSVTGIDLMLKAVNGGLHITAAQQLAIFGHQAKLKEPDYKLMLKGATAAYGTDVPYNDVVTIVKELVTAGLKGGTLEQRIRDDIAKKDKQVKADQAKKEKEKDKEKDGDKDKGKEGDKGKDGDKSKDGDKGTSGGKGK